MNKIKYLKAPFSWTPEKANPFTADGLYGKDWTCFRIHPADDYANCCGGGTKSVYTLCLGRKIPCLKQRLADFLSYESEMGRTVIVSFPEDIDTKSFIKESLDNAQPSDVVRNEDQKWIVHSTDLEAWENIRKEGILKSGRELHSGTGTGFRLLGEPPEYDEYIMFGNIDSPAPEFVVASRKAGKILTDPEMEYQPGVRLYFDCHMIIEKGLAVRDGVHGIKVHRYLPLTPFLAVAITAADLKKNFPSWTPIKFLNAANDVFSKGVSNRMSQI